MSIKSGCCFIIITLIDKIIVQMCTVIHTVYYTVATYDKNLSQSFGMSLRRKISKQCIHCTVRIHGKWNDLFLSLWSRFMILWFLINKKPKRIEKIFNFFGFLFIKNHKIKNRLHTLFLQCRYLHNVENRE